MKVEISASVDERNELINTLEQSIEYLESFYSKILDGPMSDEADVAVGAIGLSMKNLRMARNLLQSLSKRGFEFRRSPHSDVPSAWGDEKRPRKA